MMSSTPGDGAPCLTFHAHSREKGVTALTRRKSIVVKWDWSLGIFNLNHYCAHRCHANLLEAGFQYEMIFTLLPILNWDAASFSWYEQNFEIKYLGT